jgi:small subunit ribosomal protein S10
MEKIRIRLKAFDNRLLDQSVKDIVIKARRTGASISGPIPLPTHVHKFCVLRSPHVDKKSREHFEMRVHKRMIDISEYNNDTIEELQKLDLPAGIDVEIQAFSTGGE